MCAGLAAAHAEGVIHRDFKSSNVLLVSRTAECPRRRFGEGTRVAITDFGIARALVQEETENANGLTGDAGIVGTPEYMAPEQVTGGEVSQATDVYALGIVLYEMVTGRLPFTASTPLATASRRLNEPPPRPEATVPGLDPRWSRAILRCLERDPRKRFASAQDVATALTGQPPARRWPLALAAAGFLALLLGAGLFARQRWAPGAAPKAENPAAAAPSIAVLPFVDLSPQHDQGYFSDGVAEEIINALAQVSGLHVAARSSSFTFKGTNEDLRTVAQKLGVANVLEGSVRKSGNRLRVTAQLVSAQDGYQLWSQSFDSELADVFAVQDQIASAVVAALKMKVLPAATSTPSARKPTSPEAYTHYLRGLEFQNSGSVTGYKAAIEEYEKAVALDPEYAPAHAAIATTAVLYGNSSADAFETREWNRRALAEADRAVELDPNGVESLVSRGRLRTILALGLARRSCRFGAGRRAGPRVCQCADGAGGTSFHVGTTPVRPRGVQEGLCARPGQLALCLPVGGALQLHRAIRARPESLEEVSGNRSRRGVHHSRAGLHRIVGRAPRRGARHFQDPFRGLDAGLGSQDSPSTVSETRPLPKQRWTAWRPSLERRPPTKWPRSTLGAENAMRRLTGWKSRASPGTPGFATSNTTPC